MKVYNRYTGKLITNDVFETLRQHELWLESEVKEGEKANLCMANLNGADLREASFYKVDLNGADLRGANLYKANLYKADFTYANLRGANLYRADLRGIRLNGADLAETNLYEANLCGAILSGVNLYKANLYKANLRGVNLYDVNFYGVVGINYQIQDGLLKQIAESVINGSNKLDMDYWHSTCGTAHCLAGWACALNDVAKELEKTHGTEIAGLLTLGSEAHSYFYKNNEEVIEWLRTIK